MRELYLGEASCGRGLVRYYLFAETREDYEESYGILAESGGERAAVPNITVSQRRIQALAEVLMRGAVTPLTLRDVVDDWLLE